MLNEVVLKELTSYIASHLVSVCVEQEVLRYYECKPSKLCSSIELEDFIKNNKKPTFRELLFRYIDLAGLSDAEVYKKAGIDRRHFSKIRSKDSYHPSKQTVVALILALGLPMKQALELLEASGYSLSNSETADLIIKFFIEKKPDDLETVNQALIHFSQRPLFGVIE